MIDFDVIFKVFVQILSAAVGSIAFGILFNLRGKKLFSIALGGAFGWATFLLFSALGMNEVLAYFLVALLISLYAEGMARLQKAPATVFVAPSLIPLVPGSSLYYTMAYALGGNSVQFIEKAGATLSLAAALAVGIIVAAIFARLLFKQRAVVGKGKRS